MAFLVVVYFLAEPALHFSYSYKSPLPSPPLLVLVMVALVDPLLPLRAVASFGAASRTYAVKDTTVMSSITP